MVNKVYEVQKQIEYNDYFKKYSQSIPQVDLLIS